MALTYTINGMTWVEAEQLLGLSWVYDQSVLRTRYRALIKEHHPDRFATYPPAKRQEEAEFTVRLNLAREVVEKALKEEWPRDFIFGTSSSSSSVSSTPPPTPDPEPATPESATDGWSACEGAWAQTVSQEPEPSQDAWDEFAAAWERKEAQRQAYQRNASAQEAAFDWRRYKAKVKPAIWDYALKMALASREFEKLAHVYDMKVYPGAYGDEPFMAIPEVRAAGYAMAIQAYWKYRFSDAFYRGNKAAEAFAVAVPFDEYGKNTACYVATSFTEENSLKSWPAIFFAPREHRMGFMDRLHSLFA